MSNVNVFIRERPVIDEQNFQKICGTQIGDSTNIVLSQKGNEYDKEITIDGFFDGKSSQEEVFEKVGKPSIDKSLSGFNSTVIAFGATGSGKSYTTFGTEENNGLVPRIFQYIFEQSELRTQFEYSFHLSFVELYLDQFYDLLDEVQSRPNSAQRVSSFGSRPSSAANDEQRKQLQLKQSISGQFYAENLRIKQFKSKQEAIALLTAGTQRRATYQTQINERSSRSHAIFSVGMIMKNRVSGISQGSLLTFIDLAGSEALKKSGLDGQRLLEMQCINRSLLALGQVIAQLAQKQEYIRYRDNKLTKILQEALGGSSFTSMICCVYPKLENAFQTLQTFQFADRCRNVVTQPKYGALDLNDIEEKNKIKALQKEIENVKQQLLTTELERDQLKKLLLMYENQEYDASPSQRPKVVEKYVYQEQSVVQQKTFQNDGTVDSLRRKLEQKEREIAKIMKETRENTEKDTGRYQKLLCKINDLELENDRLKTENLQTIDQMRLNFQKELKSIKKAQSSLSDTSLLKNSQNEAKNLIEEELLRDRIRTQLLNEFDEQKRQEISFVQQKHKEEIEQLTNFMNSQMKKLELQKEEALQSYQKVNQMLLWFQTEHKKAYNTLQEAKEGKLDAYVLNEQEMMQNYLNMSQQKTRVKSAIQIEPAKDVQQIPKNIQEQINKIKQPQPMLPPTLHTTKPKQKEILEVIQPRLVSAFSTFKPPMVLLESDIHISPRPQTSKKVIREKQNSAQSLTLGSCGGSKELSNKVYQKWGW